MNKSGKARKAWIWSSQRIDISNAELLQLRALQIGSAIAVVAWVVRSVIDDVLTLVGLK